MGHGKKPHPIEDTTRVSETPSIREITKLVIGADRDKARTSVEWNEEKDV